MPAYTPFLTLYKPGGGSTGLIMPDEVVDIDRLNANSDLIDAFAAGWGHAAERNHNLYGPAASLSAVVGMKRGDTYQESDGSFVKWKFDGTNWLTNEAGAYLIRPTSVVNGTINPDGTVSYTAVSSVSLNGVFTSRFPAYEIQWSVTDHTVSGGSGVEFLRLRAGGVDSITANYIWRRVVTQGAGFSEASSASDTSWSSMAASGLKTSNKVLRMVGPHTAAQTQVYAGKGMEYDQAGGSITNILDYAGVHKVSSAFDSLTLAAGSGTLTGTIRVLGLV